MPDELKGNRPPKSETGHFTATKVLCYGFLFSIGMVAVSSEFMKENVQYWGYLASVLAGYIAGNTKSTVSPLN